MLLLALRSPVLALVLLELRSLKESQPPDSSSTEPEPARKKHRTASPSPPGSDAEVDSAIHVVSQELLLRDPNTPRFVDSIDIWKSPSDASQGGSSLAAVGGREVDLCIWDVAQGNATFRAKNVKRGGLDLRVPVWITAARYYMLHLLVVYPVLRSARCAVALPHAIPTPSHPIPQSLARFLESPSVVAMAP